MRRFKKIYFFRKQHILSLPIFLLVVQTGIRQGDVQLFGYWAALVLVVDLGYKFERRISAGQTAADGNVTRTVFSDELLVSVVNYFKLH